MRRCRQIYFSVLFASSAIAAGCSAPTSGIAEDPTVPPVAYCSTTQTFSVPTVTVTGSAKFEWRILGNMYVADGSYMLTDDPSASGTYTATVNGQLRSASTFADLASAIQADATVLVTRPTYGYYLRPGSSNQPIKISPSTPGGVVSVTAGTGTFTTDRKDITMGAPLNPIRFAEVRVSDSSGNLVQCAETDGSGNYSFAIPQSTGTYRVEVASRAFNAKNSAYVMRNPSGNAHYTLSTTVDSAATTLLPVMIAKASGTLEGGAFNILDQIYKAQEYVRTKTVNCDSGPYQDCVPFNANSEQHIVYTYWTPGLSPGVYIGSRYEISYYLNGKRQLFIGGGLNGNVTNSDMDQFDNSVIIHEYGHFIEDHFGNPDSPGGSHSGDAIIDPRLAWGEGWANFFQAAVLYPDGVDPLYRDTVGIVECGSCTVTGGLNIDLNLQDGSQKGGQDWDIPIEPGEGIFHEFSVSRVLYQVIAHLDFAEIWANLNGPTRGMKATNDHFKSIARFHRLQTTASGQQDWSSYRTQELQLNSLAHYATPLNLNQTTCTSSENPVDLKVNYRPTDEGSFAESDLYHNNDFYAYYHPGGSLTIQLSWTSAVKSDLDIYVYPRGYYFGEGWSAASASGTQTTNGSEIISTSLPAGYYMINVMAYTGKDKTGTYVYDPPGGERLAQYKLKINGNRACPNPTGDFL